MMIFELKFYIQYTNFALKKNSTKNVISYNIRAWQTIDLYCQANY